MMNMNEMIAPEQKKKPKGTFSELGRWAHPIDTLKSAGEQVAESFKAPPAQQLKNTTKDLAGGAVSGLGDLIDVGSKLGRYTNPVSAVLDLTTDVYKKPKEIEAKRAGKIKDFGADMAHDPNSASFAVGELVSPVPTVAGAKASVGTAKAFGKEGVTVLRRAAESVDMNPQIQKANGFNAMIKDDGKPARDLIIQHNLSESNLHHADKHNGLAVPSLAITKQTNPIDGFGEITMLGDEALAKPVKDHKVFGADIYSPRYPNIKKDLSIKQQRDIENDLSSYNEQLGKDSSYLDFDNLGDSVALKMKFLEEKGVTPNLVSDLPDENSIKVFTHFEDLLSDGTTNREYANNPAFIERVKSYLGEESNSWNDEELARLARSFAGSAKETKVKLSRADTPDFYASRQEISNQVNEFGDEFKNFTDEYLTRNGSVDKIYNGTDNQGRQKWIPHTLDNVVKQLKKDLRGGETFDYGTGSMRAKFTPEFKTIQQIRNAKDKLVSAEDFEKVKEEINDVYFNLRNKFAKHHSRGENYDFETTFNGLIEDSIKSPLRKELDGYEFNNVPDELIDELENFKHALRDMPTEYFESKVLRAMDIGEFKHAVIPNNASEKTRLLLKKKGISVTEYDPNLPKDRIAKIAKAAQENGYAFSNSTIAIGAGIIASQQADKQDQKIDKAQIQPLKKRTPKEMTTQELMKRAGIK